MQGILDYPIPGRWVTHDVMIGSVKLSKFTVVVPLFLIYLILGMDTILENLLDWNKPKPAALL